MSQLATVLAYMQTLVDGVTGIGSGRTQLGRRRWASLDHLLSVAQDPTATTPCLHLWEIRRGVAPEGEEDTGTTRRVVAVTIEGWYQIEDPTDLAATTSEGTSMTSEMTFSELVEAVCDELRSDVTLRGGGLAWGCSPPSVTTWDERPYPTQGAPECHHCVISLQVSLGMPVTWS